MKRLFFILLLFVLSIGLIACSTTKPEDNNNDNDNGNLIDDENDRDNDNEAEEEDTDPTDEELLHERILEIMASLSIEEKLGQLFIVGFPGKTVPNSLRNTVKEKRFGNFIYFGENVEKNLGVAAMSNQIQDLVLDEVGIPAFIAMDHEGGMVVRFTENATHFIGNMGLAATGNALNAYNVGKYSGMELRHYGVNLNFAPVMDVNNNPQNPVIGVRSFSDDPEVVSSYGINLIKGYSEANVLTTAKHFPGHGDTVVDSHYGLPKINHNKERLYEIELAPFIDAINAGVDSIMSAHIIFSAFDNELPATLSYKVLTELLREELGFGGLIITDEMRMQAIRDNFGVAEAGIMALKAGADMLLYAESTSTSVEAYNGVLNAIKAGEISEARIDESVYRVIKTKIKYGLFEDNQAKLNLDSEKFNEHYEFNRNLVESSITLAKGNVDWFNKEKSTLLISTKATRHPLLPGYSINTDANSFANVGSKYLDDEGATNVRSYVIGTSLKSSDINNIKNIAKNYEQVVIAVENVTSTQANLINELGKEVDNLVVVALRNPYDYLVYENINNYICTYGYFSDAVFSVFDLLLGKFEATGKLPVKVNGLN